METSPLTNRKQLQQLTQFQDTYLDTKRLESYHHIRCSVLARRSLEHYLKPHFSFFFPFLNKPFINILQ